MVFSNFSHFSGMAVVCVVGLFVIGYNINALQQAACLVVNPIMVCNFAFLFNCTLAGRTPDSMTVPT